MNKNILLFLMCFSLFASCSHDNNDEIEGYLDLNIVRYWDLLGPPEGKTYPYHYKSYSFYKDGTCSIYETVLDAHGSNNIISDDQIDGTYRFINPHKLIIKTNNNQKITLNIVSLDEYFLVIRQGNDLLHYSN